MFNSQFDFKTILRVSEVREIKRDAQTVIKTGGQGFKTWIKIDLDGNWEGQGISYVKKLNVDSNTAGHNDPNSIEYIPAEYKNYKGFLMQWCQIISRRIIGSLYDAAGYFGAGLPDGFPV